MRGKFKREEIKPCPFCGGAAKTTRFDKESPWMVSCSKMSCALEARFFIEDWNHRAGDKIPVLQDNNAFKHDGTAPAKCPCALFRKTRRCEGSSSGKCDGSIPCEVENYY